MFRMRPKSNDRWPDKRKAEIWDTEVRRPCEDRGRDWNHAAPRQGMPEATRSWTGRQRRYMLVHFTCHLSWATGYSDIWLNSLLGVSVSVLDEINIEISRFRGEQIALRRGGRLLPKESAEGSNTEPNNQTPLSKREFSRRQPSDRIGEPGSPRADCLPTHPGTRTHSHEPPACWPALLPRQPPYSSLMDSLIFRDPMGSVSLEKPN